MFNNNNYVYVYYIYTYYILYIIYFIYTVYTYKNTLHYTSPKTTKLASPLPHKVQTLPDHPQSYSPQLP